MCCTQTAHATGCMRQNTATGCMRQHSNPTHWPVKPSRGETAQQPNAPAGETQPGRNCKQQQGCSAHLAHNRLQRPAALAAPCVWNDAEGAEVVAAAHDRQVGRECVGLAHGHNVRICSGGTSGTPINHRVCEAFTS